MHDVILASEIERERERDAVVDQVPDARSGNLRDDLTDLAIWWPVLPLSNGNVKWCCWGGACVTELSEAVSFGSNRFTSVFLDVKEAGTH